MTNDTLYVKIKENKHRDIRVGTFSMGPSHDWGHQDAWRKAHYLEIDLYSLGHKKIPDLSKL